MNEDSGRDEVFITSSTRLAVALLTLGNTLRKPPCNRQIFANGKTVVTFLFNPFTLGAKDTCGKLAIKWMELENDDPGDGTATKLRERLEYLNKLHASGCPLAMIYSATGWRDVCLSIVKNTPRVVEVTGEFGRGFFHENATDEDVAKMGAYL